MKLIFLFVLINLAVSCNQNKKPKSNVVISDEKWILINAQGPKFKSGAEFKDPKSKCTAIIDYAILDDLGVWHYPVQKIECSNPSSKHNFKDIMEDEDLDKF